MKLTILLAITALLISGVAAYFSIIGLALIFSASLIPVIIMGSTVELGKLASVAWVHFNWGWASRPLKYSMTTFIIGVMLLTSVGVFGFLSRAHTEQTAAATESVAQVARIDKEVARRENIVERAEIKIKELESGTLVTDTATQEQIDKEQERIDSAYSRIQPAIDEQNAIISSQTKLFEDQITAIDAELAKLQGYIDAGEIKKAQQLIGEKSAGGWGPKTTETANKWRAERNTRKAELLAQIQEATANNPNIVAARKEIQRLRGKAEQQIADSNELINRLRDKIANSTRADNTDELLDEQYARIQTADKEIETLTDEKYKLEAEYRQLEAEVGPIKYIAEFIYGEEADADLLEKAVKWVILLLLFVLDPFAVVLVMAATDGYKRYKKEKKESALALGIDLDQVADLQDELADALEEKQQLEKVNQERIKEMNALRLQTQGIIDEANKMEEDAEKINEYATLYPSLQQEHQKLATELEAVQRERDKLQLELDNPVIALSDEDADTIAELIEQRNSLAEELDKVKNTPPVVDEINIQDGEFDTIKLLQKNQELEDEIVKVRKENHDIKTFYHSRQK